MIVLTAAGGRAPTAPDADVVAADLREPASVGRRSPAVTGVGAAPDGPVPPASEHQAHGRRMMVDRYRAHGSTGASPVPEALLGRPAWTFAGHLASVPDAEEHQ